MSKPLAINPLKLSQPMGALLAFLGIKNTMPLMHGAQGCASFTKVFFTRHFSDPIAIQTTAVNDITAVIDGGDYSISTAIENITKKVKPDLVGLFTTGLTETKGDDIKGAAFLLKDKQHIAYVHTPDFEGSLESGWGRSVEAVIDQIVEPSDSVDSKKAVVIPNVNMTPLECEKLKEELEKFGFEALALPDLSESLDGHLGLKQGALSSGGISVSEIQALGDSALVITVGESVKECGVKLLNKNSKMTHLHFKSLSGLKASDEFYAKLLEFTKMKTPPKSVIRWRKRLQDALLDTHFLIGGTKFVIADEPDSSYSLSVAVNEAGAQIEAVVLPQRSKLFEDLKIKKVVVGDFEDVETFLKKSDLLISNFHGERLCKMYHKALVLRGFPNYEEVGNQLKNSILYEGSCYLLFEVANIIRENEEGHK